MKLKTDLIKFGLCHPPLFCNVSPKQRGLIHKFGPKKERASLQYLATQPKLMDLEEFSVDESLKNMHKSVKNIAKSTVSKLQKNPSHCNQNVSPEVSLCPQAR